MERQKQGQASRGSVDPKAKENECFVSVLGFLGLLMEREVF